MNFTYIVLLNKKWLYIWVFLICQFTLFFDIPVFISTFWFPRFEEDGISAL